MPRMSKFFRLVTNLLCLISISLFITRKSFNPVLKKKLSRYIPDIKYFLLWTKVHDFDDHGQKQFIEKKCFNFNCYFTSNKYILGDIRYFDGIIFNLQDVSKGIQHLPRVRGYHQKYIFAANDSSDNYPVCDSVYDNFFNWTWTYKVDSTIPYRFISIYNLDQEELGSHFKWERISHTGDNTIKKDLATKSKTAAIFLDKCTTRSKRELFIRDLLIEMAKYNMTLDVFGNCGNKECRKKTMKPCLWKLKKYYFFYLALEDSFAEDYVTTTVLYAYQNNAVPIVYGKADYQRFLPPHSYLDGFGLGVKKLAEAMYQIVSDQSHYRQFFGWKNHYSIRNSDILDVCRLCTAMNTPTWLTHSSSYPEFRKWWNPTFEKRCAEDKDTKPKSFFSLG